MNGWASPDDVLALWLGSEDPPASTVVQAWIGQAEVMVRDEISGVAARVAADPEYAATVRSVIVAMVLRVLKNPDAVRTVTDQTGPFSASVTMSGEDPGALWLTDDERRRLSGRRRGRGRAFSIDPSNGRRPVRGLGGG